MPDTARKRDDARSARPMAIFAACAVLTSCLAGCTADMSFQSRFGSDSAHAPCAQCSPGKPASADDSSAKPAPPTTFPDALHKYIECLRCRLSGYDDMPAKDGKENGAAETKEKNGNGKEKEKGADKEKKGNGEGNNGNAKNPSADKNDKEGKDATDDKDKEEKKDDKDAKEAAPTWYSAHAQGTIITQVHDHFHSPYVGPLSMPPREPSATSETATLFFDARLWQSGSSSGELVFNPEIAGGKGLNGTAGIAGFPNGEITRVGMFEPTPYIARLFLRQTFGLGGEQEKVEDAPNLIAGTRDVNRLTVTVGKMAATDLVDDNRYSHEPRTQFLNWAIMYNGAWDYPANVRGYTYGMGLDYNTKDWAFRYGVYAEPAIANGAALDPHIENANGHVAEWEGRYTVNEHPGRLRLLAYLNHAHMGNYREALAEMPINPDITSNRAYRFKYGVGLSWDQELTKDLGVFARLGWNDGRTETWAFTAIDRLAEIGLSLKGRAWCRPQDRLGTALVVNGLAKSHRDYLAAGGLDYIIGDGRLNYGPEEILEIYYALVVIKGIEVTADFQEVNNPAYNRDRGPVSVGALRVHFEY